MDYQALCEQLIDKISALEARGRELERQNQELRDSKRALHATDRAMIAIGRALASTCGPDVMDFLQVIVDEARRVASAEHAALAIGGHDGQPFETWACSGVDAEQVKAIGGKPRPIGLRGAVMQGKRPIRLRDARQHPAFAGFPPHHPEVRSFLGVPVNCHGHNIGNLYLANRKGGDGFSDEDELAIEMLAEAVSIALEISRLRQFEAMEHERLELLARAGRVLAESLDLEATLHAVNELAVPALADMCVIALVEDDGTLKKASAHHHDPAKRGLLERLSIAPEPRLLPDKPQLVVDLCDFLEHGMNDVLCRAVLRDVGVASAMMVPLMARAKPCGLMCLGRSARMRSFTDRDMPLARDLAHHASLAIQSARIYQVSQAAIRARDNILAIVSHDLKSPVAAISLCADQLSRTGPPGGLDDRRRSRRQVELIKRATTRMDQLISGLRDAAMIEAGKFTVEPGVEDVFALVDEAFKLLEPQAEARSIRLKVDLCCDLSPVLCDRERVLQVLSNLVGNAIKFTSSHGEIKIRGRAMGEEACVSVCDTGRGISETELPHVFDRYWKGQGCQKGTGLGLTISRGIVEAHGGRIWAESTVGKGSTFFFTLPVAGTVKTPPGGG
ncbi:MAG: GAF domain-containing protein [Deltaproteobacteria bacterium]|nr:GAF domain-containing protein [Deltaproteobacteria bacterium]